MADDAELLFERCPSTETEHTGRDPIPAADGSQYVATRSRATSLSGRNVSIDSDIGSFDVGPWSKHKTMIESIYGSAMAATIQLSMGSTSRLYGMTSMLYGYLVANLVFQGYLLYAMKVYICSPVVARLRIIYAEFLENAHVDGVFSEELWQEWDHHEKALLCELPISQPVLFSMLLIVWTSYVLVDLRETSAYAFAWAHLPRPEESGCAKDVKIIHKDDNIIAEAASLKTKSIVFIMILIPKGLIALVLWWLGCCWLTATNSFESLVLNAAALAFVTNMDEIFYMAFTSVEVKEETIRTQLRLPEQAIEQTPDFDAKKRRQSICLMLSWTVLNLAAPMIYTFFFQTVLPNYKWDLNVPCSVFINELNDAACLLG